MFILKLFTFSLIYLIIHGNEPYLDASKIDSNIDHLINHIKNIQADAINIIHGFHYYNPSNIRIIQDIKICKIDNNLWVVTKGNPKEFHTGFVLYISKSFHALAIKHFFPCTWKKKLLPNIISNIISQVKKGCYKKVKYTKYKKGYALIVDTKFENQYIRLIIDYKNSSKKYICTSMYPENKQKNDVDIDSSIIFEIMEKQKLNKEQSENNLIV